jgi:hypothetical protein
MNAETPLESIYEAISVQLAQARGKALMGDREEAERLYILAHTNFIFYKEDLMDDPRYHALVYAINATGNAIDAVPTPN